MRLVSQQFCNYWKLEDAYSLAAIFANDGLELHRCDKPTGKPAQMRFIFLNWAASTPRRPLLNDCNSWPHR